MGSGAVLVPAPILPMRLGLADVEDACLNLSQDNAKAHGVGDRLTLQLHDARSSFVGDFDVVVGNLLTSLITSGRTRLILGCLATPEKPSGVVKMDWPLFARWHGGWVNPCGRMGYLGSSTQLAAATLSVNS